MAIVKERGLKNILLRPLHGNLSLFFFFFWGQFSPQQFFFPFVSMNFSYESHLRLFNGLTIYFQNTVFVNLVLLWFVIAEKWWVILIFQKYIVNRNHHLHSHSPPTFLERSKISFSTLGLRISLLTWVVWMSLLLIFSILFQILLA